MKYIYDLRHNFTNRISVAGGKGKNLHKMLEYGFNVPEGFVIEANAFEELIRQNETLKNLIKKELASVRVDDHRSITRASKKIRDRIVTTSLPEQVRVQIQEALSQYSNSIFAVRSSGVVEDNFNDSWAGQFDSYLQVHRNQVERKVRMCWASFFNERAISYNLRSYRSTLNWQFAVIVQNMIKIDISGVAFSVDPKSGDTRKMIVEGALGLGENVVSGRKTPFTAVIDKKKKIVLNAAVLPTSRTRSLLGFTKLEKLVEQVIKLEKRFGSPIDVEWAFAKDRLYLLQVRPITAVKKSKTATAHSYLPNIKEYELTFKASGLSFLFSDILSQAYAYLTPLSLSAENQFFQYMSNAGIEDASRKGISWLSRPSGFKDYERRFTKFHKQSVPELENLIAIKKLTKSSVSKFFRILGCVDI